MSTEPSNAGDNTLVEHAVAADSINSKCAKRIFALLKEGEEKINFESNPDVILVLGNTGAGKTTFTQFIAGDNDRTISTEVGGYMSEFIISDYDNKISANSTIISKTTFPELVVDSETKTAYIDNPGFNDSRNEAYDVAAAYFIKKVFDNVKNVKIILITSYPSVRKGVNRNDFLSLLEHVTVLLKDVDRFADSIALVVTKVDNAFVMYDDIPALIPDTAIIDNIASFLIEVKDSLKIMLNDGETYVSESKRVEGETFCESAIKLLDVLLTKNDSRYARLSIFRRPNRSGKLSQIKLLQDGKRIIKNMLAQNLQYLPTKYAEIGYALSDKSKNVIRDLVTEINENIVTNLTSVNADLVSYYRNLEHEMLSDMYALRDRLISASRVLFHITNMGESVNAASFINIVCENFADIGVPVRNSIICNIVNLNKFLIFLQTISPLECETFVWKWIKALNDINRYVDDSKTWYNILHGLYGRLSEYEVQKNRSSYRIPTFPMFPTEGTYVKDLPGLLDFFDEVCDKNFYETIHLEEMKKIRLDDTKIRFFDHLVQATLSNTLIYTSFDGGQRVQVAGEYILVSEVLANNLYKSCDSLQIFARRTVFVDSSLYKDNDISIIAPRWEIIGEPTINLDGSAGQPLSCPKASNPHDLPGRKGGIGIAGLPGTSAGHFFGIGNVFKSIVNLRISANGGCGGPGQDGGDGTTGQNGETFNFEWTNFNCAMYTKHNKKSIYMVPGGRGGNGGCGGVGGIGGHRGELFTIDISSSNSFANCAKINNEGDRGKNGIPGKPGNGGKCGTKIIENEYTIECRHNTHNFRCKTSKHVQYSSSSTTRVGSPGEVDDRISKNGLLHPESKTFRRSPEFIISDYINELVKNFDNCIEKHVPLRFYEEMQCNDQLKEYYKHDILSSELQCLEVNHHRYPLDTTLILYRSILEKIPLIDRVETQDYTELERLHIVVISKLLRLQAESDIYVILSLKTPSSSLINFDELDLQNVFNVLDLLIENDVNSATERIDSQILELSYPHSEQVSDNIQDLGALLLKRKLFGDLKILLQSLHLLSILANVDYQLIKEMSILNILPSLKFQSSGESAIKRKLENAIYKFQLNTVNTVDALISLILTERKSYQRSIQPKDNIVNCLRAIEEELQSTTYSCAKSFSADEAVINLSKSLKKLEALVNDENTADKTNSNEAEMTKRIEIRKKLIQFDAQIYSKVSRDSNIGRMVEALNKVENVANNLNGIAALITPVIKIILMNVTVEYDPDKILVVRKAIIGFMNAMIALLHDIRKQFDTDEELLSITENLIEIMKILRSIYGTIASTEPRSRLWKYSQFIGQREGFEKLDEFIISRDFLLHEHKHFVNVYNRLVFPYNILNPDEFAAPAIPENTYESVAYLRESLEGTWKTLKTTLDTLLKNPPQEYTIEDHFYATTNQGPLYEWKHASYAKNITDLLRGKQVALTAIVDPKDQKQFLRFVSIHLRFQALSENLQVLLNDALRNFSIRMIHLGSSSFAFCNQTHLINEEHSEYEHTADTDAEAEQLKSPYTLWLFSLHPTQENVTFHSLRPFVDQPVNLQLEGQVKYLKIEDEAALRMIATLNANYSM